MSRGHLPLDAIATLVAEFAREGTEPSALLARHRIDLSSWQESCAAWGEWFGHSLGAFDAASVARVAHLFEGTRSSPARAGAMRTDDVPELDPTALEDEPEVLAVQAPQPASERGSGGALATPAADAHRGTAKPSPEGAPAGAPRPTPRVIPADAGGLGAARAGPRAPTPPPTPPVTQAPSLDEATLSLRRPPATPRVTRVLDAAERDPMEQTGQHEAPPLSTLAALPFRPGPSTLDAAPAPAAGERPDGAEDWHRKTNPALATRTQGLPFATSGPPPALSTRPGEPGSEASLPVSLAASEVAPVSLPPSSTAAAADGARPAPSDVEPPSSVAHARAAVAASYSPRGGPGTLERASSKYPFSAIAASPSPSHASPATDEPHAPEPHAPAHGLGGEVPEPGPHGHPHHEPPPQLSLEHFACLSAELAWGREAPAAVCARYGLDAAGHSRENESWRRLFTGDHEAFRSYSMLFQHYTDWLQRSGR
jgi:hypothetical protein